MTFLGMIEEKTNNVLQVRCGAGLLVSLRCVAIASPRNDRLADKRYLAHAVGQARGEYQLCVTKKQSPCLSVCAHIFRFFAAVPNVKYHPFHRVTFAGVCRCERPRESQGARCDRVDGWGRARWRGGRYGEDVGGRRERGRRSGCGNSLGPRTADPYAPGRRWCAPCTACTFQAIELHVVAVRLGEHRCPVVACCR